MNKVKHAIIGAGISGLTYADALDDTDYLLFESESEIGGYCRTVHQDGFVWDYSGHFFHFRHAEIEEELVRRMGSQAVVRVNRDSRILYADGWVDFPFQKNIHQLPKAEFDECLRDLYAREAGEPENFKDMLYKKFGRGIAEKFLIPYNEKLYATDLQALDVDAMGRFFPHANVEEIVANSKKPDNSSYNATFTYPKGGAIEYVKAIAEGVDSTKIALNERVLSVDVSKKTLKTTKRELAYEHLISSAPFDRLLTLANVPFDRSVYSYNKVEVFNLGFDKKGVEGAHWVYFPQRDISFYRIGFYDNIFNDDRMSLYVEVGYAAGDALPDDERSKRLERVLEDLRRMGIVKDHKLLSHHCVVLDPAYVHITQASVKDVDKRRAELSAMGVHSIGRYGGWTYCSIEDNMVEAKALAKSLASF